MLTFKINNFLEKKTLVTLPSLPKSSTPSAAKMKNKRKKSKPRLPTWGKACMTVSNNARIPLAIFNNFNTVKVFKMIFIWLYYLKKKKIFNLPLAILNTLITRIIVGLMGMILDSTSSKTIPTTDKNTIPMSNWFHL